MKNTTLFMAFLCVFLANSQNKNFIDRPYLETSARVDTLVVPDEIILSVLIAEKDTKGKISVEELENRMADKLKSMGIKLDEQLSLSDVSSNFKKYVFKQQDILKDKLYSLKVYDAKTVGKVMMEMEQIGISNVEIERTSYTKMENLQLVLKSRAIAKAKKQAEYLTKPLGQKVGPAIHITDTYFRNDYESMDQMVVRGYAAAPKSEFEPLEVEFSKIKVESEVNAKFIIE
ncbi:MAG: SIMPL domain-containing protein [Flavobacteriaceae bacterium]|nr:SIMPL domain-containing protein [Flavobacteriaceae bacterium]